MPGLAGIVRFSPYDGIDQDLQTMVTSMIHNNRSTRGSLTEERCGLRLGWTAHSGSFADGMPLVSHDGNIIMVVTGESFEDSALISRLQDSVGASDRMSASYLLELYMELGEQFLSV